MCASTEKRTRGSSLPLWAALALGGCGGDTVTAPVAASISLDVTDVRFTAWGESRPLAATVADESGVPLDIAVTWSVDDATVAGVTQDGVVTSVANGTAVVTASAGTRTAAVPVSVDAPGPFNIRISYVSSVPVGHDIAIAKVERRWETIIRSELPGVDFSSNPLPANACLTGQPAVDGVVDDVLVFLVARYVDGPGGAVVGAQPCLLRDGSNLPVVGVVIFDYSDIAAMSADETELVLTHELAHVLGFGDVWPHVGYLAEAVADNGLEADAHFTGPLATAAFDAAGGGAYADGKVPVQNVGLSASVDRHWRESVFGDEVMTPFVDEGSIGPLSAVTLQSLADLGYEVDVTRADAFSLDLAGAPELGAERVLGSGRASAGRGIDVRNDHPGLQVYFVSPDGRISLRSSNGSSPSSPRILRDRDR